MRPGAANGAGAGTDGAGRAIAFEAVEPWPEPVNGCVLLVELVAALRRYVVINSLQAVAVALWIVFTYVHDAFDVSPRLNVVDAQALREDEAGFSPSALSQKASRGLRHHFPRLFYA